MVKSEQHSALRTPSVMAGIVALIYNAFIHSVSTEGKWQYVLIFIILTTGVFFAHLFQKKLPEFLKGTVLPLMIIGLGLAIGGYAHYALMKGLIPYLFVILGTGYFISGGMKMIERI